MIRKILFFFLVIGVIFSAKAQLSDLHYLPPLKQGRNNQGIQQQAIYLSTPEPTTFAVNVYQGTNNTPVATFNISKVTPAVYNLGNGDNNITLVSNANTGIVLTNSGLRFESPSGNRFYVNYRGNSSAQAASLTSKGRVAMGRQFKWGGVPNLGEHSSKSNTLGVMATEDNTTIDVFDYDSDCEFRLGNAVAGITADTYQIILNANESFVFEAYVGNSPSQAQRDGWIGASIVSDKDIVISNGAMNFGREIGESNRDAGIDQPVPENRLGKEYVFVRGNGVTVTEFPLLIAVADNTQIYVNGSATAIATINNGDYFEIPSTSYSSTAAGGNMLVKTTKDVYAYQCLAGDSKEWTTGLNFVAPVNCLLPDVMDNIPDIRNMAGTTMTGGMTIIAAVNTPDANIVVTDGGGTVALPASNPVAGSTDWKTFFVANLNGDVSVQSTGPMAVGFFGFNGNKGVAGYFSGFDTVPEVKLEIIGGGGCLPNSDVAEVTGNFDAYQWFFDGVLVPGENGPSYTPTVAGDFFCRATKGPCTYDSQLISVYYCDPDVIINKSVDKPEILEGETATFSLEVKNFGVLPLTNLQITDNIPTGLTFVSASTTTGSWSGNTWNIGTLDGGESATLELEVIGDEIDIVPLLGLINTITHTQDQVDLNITEDTPSTRITVHNDFDNDGVRDISDIDDDNDGIYDEDECLVDICYEPIINESFESPIIPNTSYRILNENDVPGWFTTATDGRIELWSDRFLGVPSFDGNQFAELNANQNSALYQNLCLTPGTVMAWSLRHRGRAGIDVMQVRIGADLASAMVEATMSDDNDSWGYYSGFYTVPAGQTNTAFIFEAVSTATGSLSVGNLIDDIQITIADVPTCGDNDGDGLPDNLDLDSDGDGCSDANEYYKNENADGSDGGEYGSGTPAVNADGSVIAAPYMPVFAPEILLGNTSEDLGGNDINGQNVSLGQTFEYVLRFQNTGDDNAVNYTIRDILPENVTLDNVDFTDATSTPPVSYTHDLASNTLNFQIPDNLVEIDDPEYSIRIQVTIALNCSSFVTACSSTLENTAFSTFQGVLNTSVFTDEGTNSSIAGCPYTPEVASNSILNDLTACNIARTVELCNANVLITAGSGFTSYNWTLNGTVVDDGDPDGDPSTFLANTIGEYVVEKTSNASCPDLIERINVEGGGTTQTNPIISYFNQVNNDANLDNDIQGEIVRCGIDGDLLPKIFLCGANDEKTIQLGITDALSIVWEKLNEGSCSDASDDCANKNGSCSWSAVSTDNNFTLTESGEFKVVIIYAGGCNSSFYFNVYKNELDFVTLPPLDIICNTPGNIRITNVGAGYGYQLIDAVTNNILIPFSANNGPNFDITNNGTYRVQITALNPVDDTPIAGTCIFETEDIGIIERDFQVDVTSTPADCNQLGTITVQAINALPNYTYELLLPDGSTVISPYTTSDNTYTFSSVNPDITYTVVTRTQDGCFDSQEIAVEDTPDLALFAITSQDITCASGIATLTPSGGTPDPDYQMAIWSKDGVDLYTDQSDIPPANWQTTPNILFRDSADAGEYVFIVKDSNDCVELSNSIEIKDLGSPEVSASHTAITCADASTSSLSVTVTGGTAPYQYSLDGGVNYQNTNTFVNLSAGLITITVMDSSNNGATGCIGTLEYEINQPFRLTASATIVEDASCNPAGALVKILNANGGQAPYVYSFDGGSNFNTNNSLYLLAGDYNLVVRDDLGCAYTMELTVPSSTVDPSFDNNIDYDCDGLGTITITPSNITDFTYSYALNGTTNTPTSNNIFSDVAVGTQTVTVGYSTSISPSQTTLIFENFGSGPTTQIGEIGADYCYEPQDGTTTTCNLGPAGILANGEYTVTNFVTNPIPSWRSPNDHSGITDGRFLAIDVSTLAGDKGVLWARRGIEVLPNQDITISLWAYNLLRTGSAGNNPEVLIELVDAGGTVIASMATAEIPKNNNADDWHNREVILNPGANTAVDIVFRTNLNSDFGNDLILDDIQAHQLPEVCEKTSDIIVVIEDNKEFKANLLGKNDPSCNGSSDGAIRFEVVNFDTATGFEYSTDGTNWITSLISPITTSATLADGTYTVIIRKISDISCDSDFDVTLTQPAIIVPSLSQTAEFTCFNTGGTLEASATGGTAGYSYRIEDTSGNEIRPFQTNSTFVNVPDGEYLVRVQDAKLCEVLSTPSVTIAPPADIVFEVTPTSCYSGTNDGSIIVNVTAGNGNYQFRLNAGAWVTPSPVNATTYTFTSLSSGSYDVEVKDQLGCPLGPNTQTVVIDLQLIVDVVVTPLSACGDGTITINATGGNSTLLYAIVPANTNPVGLFSNTNVLSVTDAMATANPSGYDVYVQDNNGAPAICSFVQEDIIFTPIIPLSVIAVPTHPQCFDGLGLIDVTVGGGAIPYTYTLIDLSPADGIDYSRSNSNISAITFAFNGIGSGNYEVTITDINSCTITSSTVTINNAIEITADIIPILPANCNDPDPLEYGFEFDNITTPLGTVEHSVDGGTTWQASNELRGYVSGSEVFPSIRVTLASGTICQKDFDRYIIPFPLDDLDITLSAIIVGCSDLRVTVEGSEGNDVLGYEYTYTDDPANFNTFAANPAVWVGPIATGTPHTFQNINPTTPQYPEVPLLVPGRTYVFYVRDGSSCIRQSNVNVNEIPLINLPIEVTTDITPSCDGAANGVITYNLNPTTSYLNMRWEIYKIGNAIPIETSGGNVTYNGTITTTTPLAEGEYYMDIIQIEADNITEACRGASENVYVPELAPLSAIAVPSRDISCNLPGLISINNISGGGGALYTYDVNGPAGFTALTGTTGNPVEIPVNSPAGSYTVTLYDQYSCPLVLNTVSLTLSSNPTISVTQDNCASPISVSVIGTSAAGNLRYALVPAGNPTPTAYEDNGGLFTNVAVGSYDAYVTDGNGCTNSQAAFVVNPVLSASVNLTKLIDCTASPDATINIEILDGSGSYEYSITNTAGEPSVGPIAIPSTNFNYQAPSEGDYTITIYDTNTPSSTACNRVFAVNVPDRIEPIIDPAIATTDITCLGNNDGTITISTSNSNAAPYTFVITSLDGAGISISPTSTSGTSATFTGLAATTTALGYIVTVTGEASTNGCFIDSASILIAEPVAITYLDAPATTVTPFGCSSDNTTNNASISIDAARIDGGSSTYARYEFIDVLSGSTLQDGTNANYIFTDQLGGDVRVIIYDDKGCDGEFIVTVPAYDALLSAVVVIDGPISCSDNLEDISIDVTGTLTNYASGNYEFRQLPSGVPQTSNEFSDLPPGNYTFAVRNTATGCEITANHSVVDPNTFDVTVEKLADVICYGDHGSIRLLMSDVIYSGGFSWEIFNTNGTPADRSDDGLAIVIPISSSPDFGPTASINLPGGNYLVEVRQDASPGCSQVRAFSITTPSAQLGLDPIVLSDVGCDNDQGSAAISPIGGLAPYDITLTNNTTSVSSPVTGVNSNLFQDLTAGQYTIVITDALGCTNTFVNEFELELPDAISGNISATDLLCQGDVDATVAFSLDPRIGISPNYRFVLNRYSDISGATLLHSSVSQTVGTFNNLGPGFYNIHVEDDLNCSFESAIVEVADPIEVNGLLLTEASLGCLSNAELQLTATGGTGSYMWSTDGITFTTMNEINGPNTNLLQNITPGTYQYYVRDTNDCISILSNEITINALVDLTLGIDTSAAVINCNGDSTAVILARADGGLGNYQYGLFTDSGLTNQVRPYQSNGIFADLPQESYYVNVQSEDCEFTSEEILIVEPELLIVNPTITNISCNGAGDGNIVLDVIGGSGDYQFAISPNLNQFDDENSFENLTVGDYTVIVQDSKGCFELVEFTITEPEVLTMTLSATPEICEGDQDGSISVIIEGGTAPYSTAIGSNNENDFVENRVTFQNLEGGDYFIYVKDANGCTREDLIRVEAGANLNATLEVLYECTGDTPQNRLNLVFEDQSVAPYILYALDSSETTDLVLEPNFENLVPGDHYIYLMHANGCPKTINFEVEGFEPLELTLEQLDLNEITANPTGGKEGYTFYFNNENNGNDNTFYIRRTDTYSVRVVDENGCESTASIYMEFIDIEIPNFFTPDGDGQNDFWIPRNIEQFPDIFITIFDRYGRKVYRIQDNEEGWNGLYQEADLPTGDYWYIIKLNGEDDEREFVGNFTLYR